MKKQNYTDLSNDELNDQLIEKSTSLQKLMHTHTISPIENPLLIKSTRKEVARIRTEISKRQQATK